MHFEIFIIPRIKSALDTWRTQSSYEPKSKSISSSCDPKCQFRFIFKTLFSHIYLNVTNIFEPGILISAMLWLFYWRIIRSLFYCLNWMLATFHAFFQSAFAKHWHCARSFAKCWRYQNHTPMHSPCLQNPPYSVGIHVVDQLTLLDSTLMPACNLLPLVQAGCVTSF